MRRILATICLTLCLAGQIAPARADLEVGQRFADLTFSGTLSAEDRSYLGLTRPGPFTLKDIQARYLLLEIFSDSCPHCILAAPGVNRLFHLIAQSPKLRAGGGLPLLKMLGVGFYGKPGQMEVWRIKHDVPFPLIPDPQARVGKAMDIPGVPTYVVLNRQGRVVFIQAVEMGSPQKFLQKILSSLDF
ncbi:MAG: TlpA disulfide reductase family protein [Deltaproteobacteria bacterium]|nr:TlpA disulfide reductase family protein [Deltaproteobacteria bacterium]